MSSILSKYSAVLARCVGTPARIKSYTEISTSEGYNERVQGKSADCFALVLKRGKVFGLSGGIVTHSGSLVSEVSKEFIDYQEKHSAFRSPFGIIPKRLEGRVAVLLVPGGSGYAHWMLDLLPRWKILLELGFSAEEFSSVLVNDTSQPFQSESLQMLGIKHRAMVVKRSRSYRAETLIVPSYASEIGHTPTWVVDYLRDVFLAPKDTPVQSQVQTNAQSGKRIFLSRNNSSWRRLTNEDSLRARLAEYDFHSVECEKLSIREQARMVSSAEIIVAPHGAALTNLVFASTGAKVLELFSPLWPNSMFQRIAGLRGLAYSSLTGEAESTAFSSNYSIAWDVVENELKQML